MKRYVTRLCSFLLGLLIAMPVPAVSFAAEQPAESGGMLASFKMEGQKSDGLRAFYPSGVKVETKTVSGKPAWVMEGKGEDNQKTIYFTLDNSEMKRAITQGTGVEIDVEYYDSGTGYFSLVYDAIYDENESDEYRTTTGTRVRRTESLPGKFYGFVDLENSNLWKTHTFYIRDAKFLRQLANDSDFYITLSHAYAGNCSEDVSVASVTVRLMDTKSPARVFSTTTEVGNIFFSDAQVTFSTDIISTVDYDFTGEAVFSAININDVGTMYDKTAQPMRLQRDGTLDEKYILEQKRETITLKAGETLQKTVTFDIDQYGLMTYRVELIDEENGIYTVYDKAFSRVCRTTGEPLHENLGMSMHYFGTSDMGWADTGYDLLDRAGITWIRGNVMWYQIESQRGRYNFDYYTPFFGRNVEKYGGKFKMYPIMDGGNHNLGDYGYENFGDAKISNAFGEFVKVGMDILNQYGIDTYEIINEPNLTVLSPQLYAGLLQAITDNVKPYWPNIRICGPATAEIPVDSDTAYIPQLFEAGGLENLDIVAVHPYNWRFAPEISGKTESLLRLRELCVEHGRPDIEIWGTETGYPTGIGNPQLFVVGNDTGELGQAAWQSRFFIMTQAEGTMDKFFIYTMNDGVDRTNTESRFGITRGPESAYEPMIAKPALIASAAMSRMMTGAECTDSIIIGEKEALAYRFSREGKEDMIALWSTQDRKALTLSLGVQEISKYDMYGNEQKLYSQDGVYDFVLDNTVTYLTGNFTDFSQTEPRLVHEALQYEMVAGDSYTYKISNNTGMPLTVKVDNGSYMESVANPVFGEDQTAMGVFKLTAEVDTDFKLQFYNGDQLYAEASYGATVTDRVQFALESCSPYNSNTLNRWAITFTVFNNRAQEPVGGRIRLMSPAEVVDGLTDIPVPDIGPGKMRRITVYLPELNSKYKEPISGMFYMNDGSEQFLSMEVSYTKANYTQTPPVLDGVVSEGEWKRGAWLMLDKSTQIRQHENWGGPENLSGRINLMWDEEYFYLAVIVTDNIFATPIEQPDRTWANDCLQIALKCDMGTTMSMFNEITICQLYSGLELYRTKSEGAGEIGLFDNFKGKVVRNEEAKTTTYEIAIPWEELVVKGFEVKPGINIAFSMLIADNDGIDRLGWIELTPGIGYEKDPRLFAQIELAK